MNWKWHKINWVLNEKKNTSELQKKIKTDLIYYWNLSKRIKGLRHAVKAFQGCILIFPHQIVPKSMLYRLSSFLVLKSVISRQKIIPTRQNNFQRRPTSLYSIINIFCSKISFFFMYIFLTKNVFPIQKLIFLHSKEGWN